jgi:hypothetical protein
MNTRIEKYSVRGVESHVHFLSFRRRHGFDAAGIIHARRDVVCTGGYDGERWSEQQQVLCCCTQFGLTFQR